uniref:Uncharacterized protein n=1 Tax=Oryza nivara TaxID=4536 RepID=A0A0E0ICP4_ORYNI
MYRSKLRSFYQAVCSCCCRNECKFIPIPIVYYHCSSSYGLSLRSVSITFPSKAAAYLIVSSGISKLLRLLLKTDKYERLKRTLISSSILDELSVR